MAPSSVYVAYLITSKFVNQPKALAVNFMLMYELHLNRLRAMNIIIWQLMDLQTTLANLPIWICLWKIKNDLETFTLDQ
jgi:hypothetical protein